MNLSPFLVGQVGKCFAPVAAIANQSPDDRVRFSKRDPVFRKRVGYIGRQREIAAGSFGQLIFSERCGSEHWREDIQDRQNRIDRVEQSFLVFLKIPVEGQWQTFDYR